MTSGVAPRIIEKKLINQARMNNICSGCICINNLYKDIDNINIPINNFVDVFKNKLEKLDDPLYVIFQTRDINGEWKRDKIKIYNYVLNPNNEIKKICVNGGIIIEDNENWIKILNNTFHTLIIIYDNINNSYQFLRGCRLFIVQIV